MIAAQNSPVFSVSLPSDLEIVLTRIFDAPRSLVFECLTKPEHVRQWWGCKEFSMTVCEIDFRVGGSWRYAINGPDGSEHGFHGVFREIVAPERIIQTAIFEMFPENETIQTITLIEKEGKTTLVCSALYPSLEARNAVIASGMETGARESYDRLEEVIYKLTAINKDQK